MVFASKVGGRWFEESRDFLRQLVKAKDQGHTAGHTIAVGVVGARCWFVGARAIVSFWSAEEAVGGVVAQFFVLILFGTTLFSVFRSQKQKKKAIQANVTEKRQLLTIRKVHLWKCGHKAFDCWLKQTNKSQGEGNGIGKSKFKVIEISEIDSIKQIDDWSKHVNTTAKFISSEHNWVRK